MTTYRFDGFREELLGNHCLDDDGRMVLRDDYEAAEECRAALREERRRRQARIDALTFTALGMLAALLLLILGR